MSRKKGDWSPVFDWPIIGIHVVLTPDNKILSYGTDQSGAQGGYLVYDVWDPATNRHFTLDNKLRTDMFCSAAFIVPATGEILIVGGDARLEGDVNYGIADVSVFDYRDRSLEPSKSGEMLYPRWYPSTVTLSNGKVLVLGGRGSMDHSQGEMHGGEGIHYPELYTPGVGWKRLDGAMNMELGDNWWYPRAWQNSKGDIVYFVSDEAKSKGVHLMDASGNGATQDVGTLPFNQNVSMPAVMYDTDRVLTMDTNGDLWRMSIGGDTPVFTNMASAGARRYHANMTLLADGTVMISGGSGTYNELVDVTRTVAIWDPDTNKVTFGDTEAKARLYHSSIILLPDARVLSLGGGAPGPLNNLNGEIYSPGYLFDPNGALSDRPVILKAPREIAQRSTFTITVEDADEISDLTFIRNGSATHSVEKDARFIDLDWRVGPKDTLIVTPPTNSNVLTPGYWMLFALDEDGTPSVAKTVKVGLGGEAWHRPTARYATLSGDADMRSDGTFELTTGSRDKGAAMFNKQVSFAADAAFHFEIYTGGNAAGAGITFVLHQDRFGADAFGRFSGKGVDNGLGIDFDTRNDGKAAGDIAADHSNFVDTDDSWRSSAKALPNLDNGRYHDVVVTWDASTRSLSYVIDDKIMSQIIGTKRFQADKSVFFGFVAETFTADDRQFVRFDDVQAGSYASQVCNGDSKGNRLTGGAGGDWLFGGGGNDILTGGRGGDKLEGGSGSDDFRFLTSSESARGSSRDVILDFKHGADDIDLSAIDANSRGSGDQSFRFIGSSGFDGVAGQLRYSGEIVSGDVNGDRIADFEISVPDAGGLTSSDFIL